MKNNTIAFALGLAAVVLLGAGAGVVYNRDTLIVKNWVQIGSEDARAAKFKVQGSSASEKTAVVKMAGSQTAAPFEIQNSSGTSVFSIDTTGAPTQSGKFSIGTTNAYTSTMSLAALARVTGTAAGYAQTYQYRFDDGAASATSSAGKFSCNAADCSDIKNIGAFFNAGHPASADVTGDSRDAVLKVSYNQHSQSVGSLEGRGAEFNITNRAAGTMAKLTGAQMDVANIATGTATSMLGLGINLEQGGTTTTMTGLDIELEASAATATEYGIHVRNTGTHASTADAALYVSDTGDNTGFDYGVDLNGATIGNAALRLGNDVVLMLATAATDGTAGTGVGFAGKGSILIKYDGSSDSMLYVNVGSKTDVSWKAR